MGSRMARMPAPLWKCTTVWLRFPTQSGRCFRALPHFVWFVASCCHEDALAQQMKASTAIHGAFDRLQSGDMPLHGAGAPRGGDRCDDRVLVTLETTGKAVQQASFGCGSSVPFPQGGRPVCRADARSAGMRAEAMPRRAGWRRPLRYPPADGAASPSARRSAHRLGSRRHGVRARAVRRCGTPPPSGGGERPGAE
jgi:hypothetical protein